jgi:hypothetical protein
VKKIGEGNEFFSFEKWIFGFLRDESGLGREVSLSNIYILKN